MLTNTIFMKNNHIFQNTKKSNEKREALFITFLQKSLMSSLVEDSWYLIPYIFGYIYEENSQKYS